MKHKINRVICQPKIIEKYDSLFWILDAGYWMLDAGYWMLDAGYWMLDTGCWILDAGCWILDAGCWMLVEDPVFIGDKISAGLRDIK